MSKQNEWIIKNGVKNFSNLMAYIKESEEIQTPQNYRLPQATQYCIWDNELRSLPGVTISDPKESKNWVIFKNLNESHAPEVPEILKGWIAVTQSGQGEDLELQSNKNDPTNHSVTIDFESLDQEEQVFIENAFFSYEAAWKSWKRENQNTINSNSIYKKMASLARSINSQRSTDDIEVVIGCGIVSINNENGQTRYPLITQRVAVYIEGNELSIIIKPDSKVPEIEFEALEKIRKDCNSEIKEIYQEFFGSKDFKLNPFNAKNNEAIFRKICDKLDGIYKYLPDDHSWISEGRPTPDITRNLKVSDGWVIFTRPKIKRSLLKNVIDFQKKINKDPIYHAALDLVLPKKENTYQDNVGQYRGYKTTLSNHFQSIGQVNDIHFTNSYDENHIKVIAALDNSNGIAVNAPARSGKTTLISNVVSHYVASGKKVLITSRAKPVLEDLKSKLPDNIKSIAMSVVDTDIELQHELTNVIKQIKRIWGDDNLGKSSKIENIKSLIDAKHKDAYENNNALLNAALNQNKLINLIGQKWSPASLAKFVQDNKDKYEWFEPINWNNESENSISVEKLEKASLARMELGLRLGEAFSSYSEENIPTVEEIINLHEKLKNLHVIECNLKKSNSNYIPNSSSNAKKVETLSDAIKSSKNKIESISGGLDENWIKHILPELIKNIGDAKVRKSIASLEKIEDYLKSGQAFSKMQVKLPELNSSNIDKFKKALNDFSSGKNAFPWWAFWKGSTKSLIMQTTVGGATPKNTNEWKFVISYMNYRDRIKQEVNNWNNIAKDWGIELLSEKSDHRDLRLNFNKFAATISISKKFSLLKEQDYISIFNTVPHEILDINKWDEWKEVLDLFVQRSKLMAQLEIKENLLRWAIEQKPSIRAPMEKFILEDLGAPDLNSNQIKESWLVAEMPIIQERQMAKFVNDIDEAANMLEQAGAPVWAERLALHPFIEEQDPWVKRDWHSAWKWSKARDYLRVLEKDNCIKELQTQAQIYADELKDLYSKLSEQLIALHLKTNIDEVKLNQLENCLNSISQSPNLFIERTKKQIHSIYKNIPCWIIGQGDLEDWIPLETHQFDLVIIDDASSCDLSILTAVIRGKKLLVLGDEQQISPERKGIKEEEANKLFRHYLESQPYALAIGQVKSFYDFAKAAYSGKKVELNTIYKGQSNISQYVNQEFYNSNLNLGIINESNSNCLAGFNDVRVINGYRKPGSKLNLPEARAIVDQLKEILKSNHINNKKIGIVSLMGIQQAKYIENLINEEIDFKDILQHEIICGDAKSFHGQSRDILMVSMVLDPSRIVPSTKQEIRRRYNTVLSHANDQIWLFRSIDTKDLNNQDIRNKLISFIHTKIKENTVKDTRKLKTTSWLCEEIQNILQEFGFDIEQNIKITGIEHDLIVKGSKENYLAIQLLGNDSSIINKQVSLDKMIESLSNKVWLCSESAFIMKPTEHISTLIKRLDDLGIKPQAKKAHQYEKLELPLSKEVTPNIENMHEDDIHDGESIGIGETQFIFS